MGEVNHGRMGKGIGRRDVGMPKRLKEQLQGENHWSGSSVDGRK